MSNKMFDELFLHKNEETYEIEGEEYTKLTNELTS